MKKQIECYDAQSLPTPSDEEILAAWVAAKDIIIQRERQEAKREIESLERKLSEQTNIAQIERGKRQDHQIRLRGLADGLVTSLDENLSDISELVKSFLGPLTENQLPVRIRPYRKCRLVITGRVRCSDGRIPTERELLFQIAPFGPSFEPIMEKPSWLNNSPKYGFFKYINCDRNGRFHQTLEFDEIVRSITLRPVAFQKKSETEIFVEELDLLNLVPSYESAPANSIRICAEGRPFRFFIALPSETKFLQFLLYLQSVSSEGARINMEIDLVGPEGVERRSFSTTISEFSELEWPISVASEASFNQAKISIRPDNGDRPALFFTNSIDCSSYYPNNEIMPKLLVDQKNISRLEKMADDWESRGKWLGVNSTIDILNAPALMVLRHAYTNGKLNVSFSFRSDGSFNRKGAVISHIFYDGEGRILKADNSNPHPWSESVGFYKYISTVAGVNSVFDEIAVPESVAYVSIIFRSWGGKSLTDVSPSPVVEGMESNNQILTASQFHPLRPYHVTRHGVFIEYKDGSERPLHPNSYILEFDGEYSRLIIRFAMDEEVSMWRDLSDGLMSPNITYLREIVHLSRNRNIKIVVDCSEIDGSFLSQMYLFEIADVVIYNSNQESRVQELELQALLECRNKKNPKVAK